MTLEETPKKLCTKCNHWKTEGFFGWLDKGNGKRKYRCKSCDRKYAKEHYKKRKAYYIEKGTRHGKVLYDRNTAIVLEYKKDGCTLCPEKEPYCLDFHHINPEDKTCVISQMKHRKTELLIEEIQKCVVVCANCHRKIEHGIIELN